MKFKGDRKLAGYKIGDLAEQVGMSAPTIRYYEEIGLLRRADRQNGQRRYGEADIKNLILIRRWREFGFSIGQVRELVALTQDRNRSCLEARELSHAHLLAIRAKLRELKALEKGFTRFLESCETACAGGPGPDCAVLNDLVKPKDR